MISEFASLQAKPTTNSRSALPIALFPFVSVLFSPLYWYVMTSHFVCDYRRTFISSVAEDDEFISSIEWIRFDVIVVFVTVVAVVIVVVVMVVTCPVAFVLVLILSRTKIPNSV